MTKDPSFLGKGWGFPPTFTRLGDTVNMVQGREDIEQCLQILLNTKLGARIMEPEFGCDLRPYLFQPLDLSIETQIKDVISLAILNFESRIILNEIILDDTQYLDGLINIRIDYTIRKVNSRFNMVFPFYLHETP
ncbi:MAG: GPW/gp25 family protein [Bacteroidota bacterium]